MNIKHSHTPWNVRSPGHTKSVRHFFNVPQNRQNMEYAAKAVNAHDQFIENTREVHRMALHILEMVDSKHPCAVSKSEEDGGNWYEVIRDEAVTLRDDAVEALKLAGEET